MYTCDLEKNQSGKEILKWRKIEGNDEDSDRSSDGELNNSSGQYTKRGEEKDIIDITGDRSMNISLDDLFPPEKISADYKPKIKIEEKVENGNNSNNKKKLKMIDEDDNNINEFYNKDHEMNTSRITNKTQEITIFDINNEDSPLNKSKNDNFGIALTGNIFEKLFKLNEKYLKNKDPKLKFIHQSYRLILKNGRVFARMAPEHKALLVEAYKKEGFTTLMCGDGANDCAALRTAHVGVSLSEEDASIAAGFTSLTPDVSCIFELLKEGKCSLTTSIQTFKYMMLYSMIQFICVNLMLIYITYLSDFQFLVSDLFIIFPLEWFLAMTHPHDKLTHHYPVSGLLSFPVIISIIAQTALVFVFQFGGYHILRNHYGFENICDFDDNEDPMACHENTIYFLIAHFQYLTLALAFSVSKPFRQPIYTNWPLMIYLVLIYFYSIWITINCDDWSAKLFLIYDLKYRGESEEEEEEMEDEDDGENEANSDGNEDNLDENENGGGEEEGEDGGEDEDSDIIPGGDKMKYYLFLIIGINMIINIFIEWFVMKYVNICYENKLIKNYKKEIEEEKIIDAKNKAENKESEPNNKEVQIFKYQRIYYYDRRKKNKKRMKENKNNDVNIYSSTNKINIVSS
jgi:soluble P-type ATPase